MGSRIQNRKMKRGITMNKKKGIFITILLTLMIGMSFMAVSSYESIGDYNKKRTSITWNEWESDYLIEKMYALDAKVKGYTSGSSRLENYTSVNDRLGEIYPADDLEQLLLNDEASFTYEMSLWVADLTDPNVHYYIKDKGTNKTQSNVDIALDTIKVNTDIQKKYQNYVMFSFDENGNFEVLPTEDYTALADRDNNPLTPSSVSFDSNVTTGYDAEGNPQNLDYVERMTLKNPKNVDIVIAVPNEIKPTGEFYERLYSPRISNRLAPALLIMIVGAGALLSLFMLFYKFSIEKECNPYKSLSKIKFEFLAFAGIFSIVMNFIAIMWFAEYTVMCDLGSSMANFVGELALGEEAIFIVNMGLWIVLLFLVSLAIYEIKLLFHVGLKRFLLDYTFVGWLYRKAIQVINVDLNDEMMRSLLKIVLINFIIIVIVSFVFGFGLFFAFVYTLVLYVILRDKFKVVQKDYKVIMDATKDLSDGNFDVEIRQDVGMFNSLKTSILNIKDGYKEAVKEEVKSQRMKTELISNVSHDLKTPLTSIITYVDLLKKEEVDEAQRQEYIAVLDRNALRLKQLIEDLFEVSKANSGNVSLQVVDVDIVALMRQALFECSDALQKKNLDIRSKFADEKIICPLDSSKTYRVFENLLMNISKYTLENTRVYVEVEEDDHNAIITFKNISAYEMNFTGEEIVERFVQGDKSRKTKGSGLGLAIAKSFSEIQGGTFKVEVDGDLFKVCITYPKRKGS